MVLLFIKEKIVIVSLVFNKGAQVTFTAGFKHITFLKVSLFIKASQTH